MTYNFMYIRYKTIVYNIIFISVSNRCFFFKRFLL